MLESVESWSDPHELLHRVLDELPVAVVLQDARGEVAFANGAATRMAGGAELVGRRYAGIFEAPPASPARGATPCVARLVRPSGPAIEVELSELPSVNGVLFRPAGEEARMRQILAHVPGFVFTRDRSGAVTVWTDDPGVSDCGILLDAGESALRSAHLAALGGRKTICDIVLGAKTFAVRVEPLPSPTGEITAALTQAFDVTNQRRASRRRRDRLCFDAAARLASSVGRALEQALAPIFRATERGDRVQESDVTFTAALRGARIAASLLAITEAGAGGHIGAVPVADVLRRIGTRLRRMPGGKPSISLEAGPGDLNVAGSEALISTLVERLCLAMVGSTAIDDKLALRLERRLLGPRDLPACGPGGSYAMVTLTLHGSGGTEPLPAHPWEPRLEPQSLALLGLSLPAVYNAVKSLGGFVEIEDLTDGCRRATLCLPELDGPNVRLRPRCPTGRGAALVVHDDERDRFAASALVRRLGFEAIEAPDGEAAIALFARHPRRFDVVLLDIRLPGKDGLQVLTELRGLDPDVPVVLCTGSDRDAQIGSVPGRVGFLQKPFDQEDLAVQLRWVGGSASAVGPRR